MFRFGSINKLLSTISDYWGLLQWLFPSLGAIVTTWLAAHANEPWHMVVFYGAGVFCFLALALIKYSEYALETTVKYKLVSEDFGLKFVNVNNDWTTSDIC